MPPVSADQGYWYVLHPVWEDGVLTPGEVPGPGFTAWYGTVGGTLYAVVRTPVEVAMESLSTSPLAVLAAGGHDGWPFGRIGGG